MGGRELLWGQVEWDAQAHTAAPVANVRIFREDNDEFGSELRDLVAARLRPLAMDTIKCGQWIYRSGNDFDLVVLEELP